MGLERPLAVVGGPGAREAPPGASSGAYPSRVGRLRLARWGPVDFPHTERESEMADLAANGSVAELFSFRAELGSLGGGESLVSKAWDLEEVANGYRNFIAKFSRQRPKSPEAVFRAQTMLVHEWRKFPFLDPDLPDGALPSNWPRARAHEVFHERHAAWQETAREYFLELERAASTPAPRRASSVAMERRPRPGGDRAGSGRSKAMTGS